jgi:hypothetical protein
LLPRRAALCGVGYRSRKASAIGLATSAKIASAGPEAFELAAELVGQRDAGRHQVVAAAGERAQAPDRVGGGRERPEAVAVGAQKVGEQIGVAAVVLGAGGAVARARGLHHVRVNRHHRVAGLDQHVDDQPRRPLDRDRQSRGIREARQTPDEDAQPFGVVSRLEAFDDGAGLPVDDADGVNRAAPVQSCNESHIQVPLVGVTFDPVGRTCGKLIIRRSGTAPLGHQPVARRILPAPAARQVSSGPFAGEPRRPSRRATGSGSLTPLDTSLPEGRVA